MFFFSSAILYGYVHYFLKSQKKKKKKPDRTANNPIYYSIEHKESLIKKNKSKDLIKVSWSFFCKGQNSNHEILT